MSQLIALDGTPLPDPPPENLAAAAPAVSIMLITRNEGDDFNSRLTEFLPLLLSAGSALLMNELPLDASMDWMADTRRRFQNGDYGVTAQLNPEQAARNTRARAAGMGRVQADYVSPEGDRMTIIQQLPAELMPILLRPEESPPPPAADPSPAKAKEARQ